MELQKKYYHSIIENYTLHCENGGDYFSYKNLINNNLCFQKIDKLVIDNFSVTWCYHDCISEYWTLKLIDDLLLPVNIENLILNGFDLKDTSNNVIEYHYFIKYEDFLVAKDDFLNNFK